ncbi:hypothetical protein ACFQ7F_41840 [Streptomyces sp. NPDC056486]|uniref:hypothetical protein n=1 Tax=Streptomyces sp. NPDC056486 TaxID=3345835 RepID=UPI0036887D98
MTTHTVTLAAISETTGRLGAGGAALILGAVLVMGIKYGKLKGKKGLLAFLGLMFAAACVKASGTWDLFTDLADIPGDVLRSDLGLGDVGPAAPPMLAVAILALRKNSATQTAMVAFWLYVTCGGTGQGSIWWVFSGLFDNLVTRLAG